MAASALLLATLALLGEHAADRPAAHRVLADGVRRPTADPSPAANVAPPGAGPQRSAIACSRQSDLGLDVRVVRGAPVDSYAAHLFEVRLHGFAQATADPDKRAACLRAVERLRQAWRDKPSTTTHP